MLHNLIPKKLLWLLLPSKGDLRLGVLQEIENGRMANSTIIISKNFTGISELGEALHDYIKGFVFQNPFKWNVKKCFFVNLATAGTVPGCDVKNLGINISLLTWCW